MVTDGSWLMSWGSLPVVGGYSPSGARTFALVFGGVFSYRPTRCRARSRRRRSVSAWTRSTHA